MPRSLKIAPDYISLTKSALLRNSFARQQDLAEDVGLARSTVSNFLNGKPVDYLNFYEISERLGLDWQKIADFQSDDVPIHQPTESQSEADSDDFIEEIETEVSHYVHRPEIESSCYHTLNKPGSLLRIKAPQRLGKTTLTTELIQQFKQQGYHTALVNLQLADVSVLQEIETFIRWFCAVVSRQLKLPNQLVEYWDEDLGSSYNCKIYFEEYLLPQLETPIILALDEVDHLFPYTDIAADFLGLLRAWHDEAQAYPIWQKLRLIVVHSTEVYIPLDINQSPFNVGVPIDLPEFTTAQVTIFAQQQKLQFNQTETKQLINLVGGHPYLLQRAFYRLSRHGITLNQLLETAQTESGIYGDHLRGHLLNLQQYPDLVDALKQVVHAEKPIQITSKLAYYLKSLGLIELQGDYAIPRYPLYRQYFCSHL
ncbi:MAG: AAA-like domain-containing protein [Microcoleaceae cyanobacterium]